MPLMPALTTVGPGVITATPHNNNYTTIHGTINSYVLFKDVAAQTVSVSVTWSAAQTFSAGVTITGSITMLTSASKLVPGATSFAIRDSADANDNLLVSNAGLVTVRAGLTITAGNVTISAGQISAKRTDAGDSGTAKTLDFNTGNIQKTRLTGTPCTLTFSNPVTGAMYVVELLQDATGTRLVTWPATVKWDGGVTPTLTTTASRKDIFTFVYNGTNYMGSTFGTNFVDTI